MTSAGALRGLRRWSPPSVQRPPAVLVAVAAGVALLALLPLVYLGVRALDGGLDALQPVLRARTLELITNTVLLGAAVGLGATALGVPLAWLTTMTDLPGRRAWSVVVIAPLAIPSYLLAFSFVAALGPRGWIPSLFEPLGPAVAPSVFGFGGAAVVLTLATIPYVVIATRAALARLDPAVEEAARSLGSGPWEAARTSVVPVIVPAVGAGALLAILYAVSDFGSVSILRFDSLPRAIYSQYRFSFDRSGAAALALVLVVLALALVAVEERMRRRAAAGVTQGRRRPPSVVRLGRWRWPSMALCATVAGLSLALPVATVATWLANGLSRGLELGLAVEPLRGSLALAGAAALVAVGLGVPLARLVASFPGRWARATERLLYTAYAVPGISLALAFAFFTLSVVPTLYQTLAALVIAVALRFLIQAVGAMRGPMSRISPRLSEAARSLGERPVGVTRTIVLPLLRPGLIGAAALVLLSALKELPLTLLLAPTGFRTLATDLWDRAREGFYAQAAVPAALLLVVSLVSVLVLVRREEPLA
jgi:iron(III) transport system permease protein